MDVAVVEEKVGGMRKMVEDTKITNEEELAAVADKIKNIKTLGKWIRQQMEEITKPAREIITNTQKRYLPYEKECKAAEAALKLKAEAYMAKEEEKRKAREASIANRVESGKLKEETGVRKMEELGEEKKTVDTGAASLTRKMVKKAVIVDMSLIPKEYWVVDEKRVTKAALAGAVIPGVEVREVPQMSVR